VSSREAFCKGGRAFELDFSFGIGWIEAEKQRDFRTRKTVNVEAFFRRCKGAVRRLLETKTSTTGIGVIVCGELNMCD
jgi:hypothetical protein